MPMRTCDSLSTMAAFVIATLALIFTVGSFWWLHAREGHLVANRPAEFAMALTAQQSRLRIPLVIYNTGARTLVVEALRLKIGSATDKPLEWITTRDRLQPASDEEWDFCSPFAIDGRHAVQRFVEFGETPPAWKPDPGTTQDMTVEARTLRDEKWQPITRYRMTIPTRNLNVYTTHKNEALATSN